MRPHSGTLKPVYREARQAQRENCHKAAIPQVSLVDVVEQGFAFKLGGRQISQPGGFRSGLGLSGRKGSASGAARFVGRLDAGAQRRPGRQMGGACRSRKEGRV